MNTPILHGENAVIPIAAMPAGAVETHTTFIIGHSETGHHHVLEAEKGTDFDIITKDGELYFTTTSNAKIVHRKSHDIHETVKVLPGIYKVNRKQEYDPFEQVRRDVWD